MPKYRVYFDHLSGKRTSEIIIAPTGKKALHKAAMETGSYNARHKDVRNTDFRFGAKLVK